MLASAARGIFSLTFFRTLLGLGEAGPWPGAVKSNAEWFPVKQRAFAQGLFGAGGSIGSVLAPIVISMLYLSFGWRSTFLIVGSLGILWIIPWIILNKGLPEDHPAAHAAHQAHADSAAFRVWRDPDRGVFGRGKHRHPQMDAALRRRA